ncbi:MAG: outer membrane beta-barrel protein [Hyphomicrobium sp.]
MSSLRAALFLGAAIVLGSGLGASAADLYGGSMKDGPVMMPMASAGPSLYIRADGGYGSFDNPSIVEDHLYDLSSTSIDNTWSVGGGVGVYFGRGLRGDITIDRRFEADVEGDLPNQSDLHGVRRFGMKSTVALANVYYDIDVGQRFTPYLGVGLGFTRNETTAGSIDTCGCTTATIEGDSDTHVAAAAMAGFSLKLRGGSTVVGGNSIKDAPMTVDTGRGLYLDVGYRFLYLGDAATGPITAQMVTGPEHISDDPTVEDIHAHEIRFGLRYDLR